MCRDAQVVRSTGLLQVASKRTEAASNSHMKEPAGKQILQPQSNLQMNVAPANILTVGW